MDIVQKRKNKLMNKPKMYKVDNDPVISAILQLMPVMDVLDDVQKVRVLNFIEDKYFGVVSVEDAD
jgi:hypothetical protein